MIVIFNPQVWTAFIEDQDSYFQHFQKRKVDDCIVFEIEKADSEDVPLIHLPQASDC